MFDQVFSAIQRTRERVFQKRTSRTLYTSRKWIDPTANKLVVILDPWHMNPRLFHFVEKKVRREGQSYIHFSFAPEILSADEELTKKRFETFSSQIRGEIKDVAKQNAITQCTIIGVSLSCVTASLIANNNPLINELIMVVPGHSLAASLWHGLRTSPLQHGMAMRGVELAFLEKHWEMLAPEFYLPKLSDKKMRVIISKTDRIIPAKYGRRYVEMAKKYIPQLHINENRHLGHYASILHYCLLSKDISA